MRYRIKKGRYRGKWFYPEGDLQKLYGMGQTLLSLARDGNRKAIKALNMDRLPENDGSILYGKIDTIGIFIPKDYI